jgi:TonB family protein
VIANNLFPRPRKFSILGLIALLISLCVANANAQESSVRIAILDFGNTSTGQAAMTKLRHQFANMATFFVIDPGQSKAAVAGAGYAGSLNLSLLDARDLGAAIGCDFFVIGDADTLRRSPSNAPVYFESYASMFVVSARTGRLVLWQRPATTQATAADAEKALLELLSSTELRDGFVFAIHHALESERAERAARVENATPVIEVMSDDSPDSASSTRPPRPYRRIKPEYPEAAAHSRVEAIVDVLVDIDEKGEVHRIEIARWAGYGLDESVVAAVKQMHFFPAMRDGRATPMRVLLRYNFRKPAQ